MHPEQVCLRLTTSAGSAGAWLTHLGAGVASEALSRIVERTQLRQGRESKGKFMSVL